MEKLYKKQINEIGITIISYDEGSRRISFTETPGNRHYEEYLEWVEAGGVAEVIEG